MRFSSFVSCSALLRQLVEAEVVGFSKLLVSSFEVFVIAAANDWVGEGDPQSLESSLLWSVRFGVNDHIDLCLICARVVVDVVVVSYRLSCFWNRCFSKLDESLTLTIPKLVRVFDRNHYVTWLSA